MSIYTHNNLKLVSSRQTRFSDVCGTTDEWKRLLHEPGEKGASNRRDFMDSLLKDVFFMLKRMMKGVA